MFVCVCVCVCVGCVGFGDIAKNRGRLMYCLSMGHRLHLFYLNTMTCRIDVVQYTKSSTGRGVSHGCACVSLALLGL